MKFKSALLTQASGSLAGMTAARNRGGMYLRSRATIVQPATDAQRFVRDQLTLLSQQWQSLVDPDQRAAWALYAANTPTTDALGASLLLTALNMFLRCNVPRLNAGLDPVLDGPTTFGLPTFTPVTIAPTASDSNINVAYANTDDWATADGGYLLVQGSRPVPVTINFFKGPWRFSDSVAGDGTTPPTSPADCTNPFPLAEGQRLYVRVQASNADGRLSSSQIIQAEVAT